jgi:hypothetical protein
MHLDGRDLNDIVRRHCPDQAASVAQKGWIDFPKQFIEGRSVPALGQEHELDLIHKSPSLSEQAGL